MIAKGIEARISRLEKWAPLGSVYVRIHPPGERLTDEELESFTGIYMNLCGQDCPHLQEENR